MKKSFTILIAAIAAILMMAQPNRIMGQTATKTEGFEHATTNSTYNSTYSVNATGNSNYSDCGIGWSIYYGCVSTTNYISGSRSAHMRYYTSASSNLGYAKTTTGITGLTNVSFNARVSNTTNKLGIWYNTDGGDTWTPIATDVTFESASTSTPFSYNIPNSSILTTYYIKIGISSASTNKAEFIIDDVVFTYSTGGGSTTASPSISGDTPFLNNTTVTIANDASATGADIFYTLNGDDPTTTESETCFAYSAPFSITATTTVKAIAKKSTDTNASSVVTKTFTKITPLANIAALSSQTEAGTYYVTLDDAVVTFTNGYYAYIQDESGAILYYKNGHGLSAGQRFTGTANVTLAFDNNNPEITTLSGVTPTSGDAPEPTTVVASAWNYTFNNVLSQYIKITDAQITNTSGKYYVSVGSAKAVQSIQLYGRGDANNFSISNLSLDDRFTIVGFPTLYKSTNEFVIFAVPQKEDIYIGSSSAIQLSYAANASGSMTVGYSNFTPTSVTAALYSDSGCSSSFSGDWISITSPLTTPFTSLAYNVSANETGADRTVYMKINATNANGTIIHKIFTITQVLHQTYSVTYKANGGTGEDLEVTGYDYNAPVTVKANEGEGNPNFTKAGYTFQNWNTNAGGTGTTYNPNSTFNITANIDLYAKWQANTYDLNVDDDMENGSVSFKVGGSAAQTAQTGQTVTIVITPASGYKYTSSSLTVTNDATSETVTVSNTNTFTMPASSVTVSAEFEVYYALTIDFESALDTYSNWEFDNNISRYEYNSSHAGSYCGINYNGSSATTSGTITTKNKIATPGTLSFYVKRTGSNTKTAVWKVYTKADNGDWTQRGSDIDATASDWTEASIDLSSYTNVYVKIAYSGNNAQYRAIDDICLEYTPTEYAVSVSNVANGTISASDGTTTITEGNSANIESAKTITLTAEGDATHMFSAWTVTGATVDDASSATTTFEMPANAVTVSASFVESWTFTYNINGNVVAEKYLRNNATITLPTTSEYVPEGYSIIGWTATEGDVSSPITSATASQDRNLFAVFGKITFSDFTLVESAPSNWSGYYLIVYNNSTTLNTHSNNLDVNSYGTTASIAAYYDNKVIKSNSTTVQYIVKIEQTTNGYSIYAKDGYLGYNQTTSGTGGTGTYLRWDTEFTSSQNEWTIGVGSIVSCYYSSRAIRYNSSANPARFAIYATTGQDPIQLFKTTVSNEGAYTHIYPSNATATGDINVGSTGPIVIESGGILDMGSHTLTCTDATKLIIEDGAQLKFTSTSAKSDVQATVQKNITGYTDDHTGWNFIASPISGSISPNEVTNLLGEQTSNNPETYNYDLYRFNPSEPDNKGWENYHQHNDNEDPFLLVNGQGYLYAKSSTTTLSFAGAIKPYITENNANRVALAPGWNLVGNPYTFNVYSSKSYYAITTVNDENVVTAVNNASTDIAPCTGIVVKNTGNETDYVYFLDEAGSWSTGNNGNLQMVLSQTVTNRGGKSVETLDNAIVSFNEGSQLEKFYFGNQNANIYIPQDKEEYAIVSASAFGELPVNFTANQSGEYTLTFNAEDVEMNYLHLIDNMTGANVDLLANPSYTFNANVDDYESRFRLVFSAKDVETTDGNADFAFINDGNIIVAGTGTVRVYDITGRMVASSDNANSVSTVGMTPGVYVLQLVNGTETKTQKIIVK